MKEQKIVFDDPEKFPKGSVQAFSSLQDFIEIKPDEYMCVFEVRDGIMKKDFLLPPNFTFPNTVSLKIGDKYSIIRPGMLNLIRKLLEVPQIIIGFIGEVEDILLISGLLEITEKNLRVRMLPLQIWEKCEAQPVKNTQHIVCFFHHQISRNWVILKTVPYLPDKDSDKSQANKCKDIWNWLNKLVGSKENALDFIKKVKPWRSSKHRKHSKKESKSSPAKEEKKINSKYEEDKTSSTPIEHEDYPVQKQEKGTTLKDKPVKKEKKKKKISHTTLTKCIFLDDKVKIQLGDGGIPTKIMLPYESVFIVFPMKKDAMDESKLSSILLDADIKNFDSIKINSKKEFAKLKFLSKTSAEEALEKMRKLDIIGISFFEAKIETQEYHKIRKSLVVQFSKGKLVEAVLSFNSKADLDNLLLAYGVKKYIPKKLRDSGKKINPQYILQYNSCTYEGCCIKSRPNQFRIKKGLVETDDEVLLRSKFGNLSGFKYCIIFVKASPATAEIAEDVLMNALFVENGIQTDGSFCLHRPIGKPNKNGDTIIMLICN